MAEGYIPFVSQWRAKITRIEKMWLQPCGSVPVFWVLGYFAASPAIVFSLLKPDCLDATFDRVGRSHRKRRKMSFRAEDMATPLPAPTGGVGWWLWSGAKLAQKIGFWTIIVDGVLDWNIYGTSFAFQMSGCSDPNQGHGDVSMTNTVPLLLPATTARITSWVKVSDHIFVAGPTGIATPKNHQPGIGFSITQHTGNFLPLPDCTFVCRIVDVNTGMISPELTPEDMGDGTRVVNWSNPMYGAADASHNFQCVVTKTFGVMEVSGMMKVTGLNVEGFEVEACGRTIK